MIRNRSRSAPRIRHVGQSAGRVSSAEVARALGAERVGTAVRSGGPLTIFAVREELTARLRSTGGRRSLEGTTRRQKIPLGEVDWLVLEYLARQLATDERRPTASQVASAILRRALATCAPVEWLATQVEPALRDLPTLLWLFAEAVRLDRDFACDDDARRRVLADARAQGKTGEVSAEVLCRLEAAKEVLPRAYAKAREATAVPVDGPGAGLTSA